MPADLLAKRRAQHAELREATLALAGRLEKNGIPVYRDSQFHFWFSRVHSGEVERFFPFRHLMILPAVAASVRRPLLREADAFHERNPFLRFWTFTNGQRCRVAALRKRFVDLLARLRELNEQPFMRDLGVEIVLASLECGTPEFDVYGNRRANRAGELETDAGGVWYHPHAHTLVYLRKGPVRHAKWCALFRQIWAFWGWHWDAGTHDRNGEPRKKATIHNVREVLKYMVKPAALAKISDAELVAFYRATSRLRIVQPLGALKSAIEARKAAGEVLVKRPAPNGEGRVWRSMRNWNASDAPPRDKAAKPKLRDPREIRVLARCLPTAGAAGLKEPGFVVMTAWPYTAAQIARLMASHALVKDIRDRTAELWAAGVELAKREAIRVHTCTLSSLPTPAAPSSHPRAGPHNRQFGDAERRKRHEMLATCP